MKRGTGVGGDGGDRPPNLIVVLVQHDDDLRHVVELGHGAQVVHGLFPLPVLLLLQHATHHALHICMATDTHQLLDSNWANQKVPNHRTSSRPP